MPEILPDSSDSPSCQTCGACCAAYRVSFYWAEAAQRSLPEAMTERVTPWHSALAGTNQAEPRCHALSGQIGQQVTCGVYAQRPSPCREVQPGDEKCQRARALHGLPPWEDASAAQGNGLGSGIPPAGKPKREVES